MVNKSSQRETYNSKAVVPFLASIKLINPKRRAFSLNFKHYRAIQKYLSTYQAAHARRVSK